MSEGERSTKPAWAGRLPFEPDEKRPCHFTADAGLPRIYGKEGGRVTIRTFLSTDKLSASSFQVPPGTYFEPFDIHGGDEVYYVARGAGKILNPITGRTVSVEAGDMLLLPQGVWHQFYNFGEDIASIVTAFSPQMWTEMGTAVEFPGEPLMYAPEIVHRMNYPSVEPERLNRIRPPEVAQLGSFPVDGAWARTTQEMFLVRPGEALNVIHGETHRALVAFFISNDLIHAGTMTLPHGRESDSEVHRGDELIYVVKGTISAVVMEEDAEPAARQASGALPQLECGLTGAGRQPGGQPAPYRAQKHESTGAGAPHLPGGLPPPHLAEGLPSPRAVSGPRFEVKEGERFFVPEGLRHYYFNLGPGNAEFVFFIAPEL